MRELNWYWISMGAAVPTLVGLFVAFLFWRKGQVIFGNVIGTGVMFTAGFALIFREYGEIDIIVQRCIDAGYTCYPEPSAFTRFAIYAFIALLEVFVLFYTSIRFEERERRRDYAPEWQR